MLRWLFIGLVIYMIYRLISGPNRKRRQNPFFTFRYGQYPNESGQNSDNRSNGGKKNYLDQIEDAEFEDITEEDLTKNKSDK